MNHLDCLTESVILDANYSFDSVVLEVSVLDRIKEKSIHNTVIDTIKKWVVKIRNYIAKLIQSWIKKIRVQLNQNYN